MNGFEPRPALEQVSWRNLRVITSTLPRSNTLTLVETYHMTCNSQSTWFIPVVLRNYATVKFYLWDWLLMSKDSAGHQLAKNFFASKLQSRQNGPKRGK